MEPIKIYHAVRDYYGSDGNHYAEVPQFEFAPIAEGQWGKPPGPLNTSLGGAEPSYLIAVPEGSTLGKLSGMLRLRVPDAPGRSGSWYTAYEALLAAAQGFNGFSVVSPEVAAPAGGVAP